MARARDVKYIERVNCFMSNGQKLMLGLLVFGVSYGVLSQRECRTACQSVFQPLASEGGKLIASALVGMIVTGIA